MGCKTETETTGWDGEMGAPIGTGRREHRLGLGDGSLSDRPVADAVVGGDSLLANQCS